MRLPQENKVGTTGDTDILVKAYTTDGTAKWTKQYGTASGEDVRTSSVSSSGSLWVGGASKGNWPGGAAYTGTTAYWVKIS